jgi:hypothetical protein
MASDAKRKWESTAPVCFAVPSVLTPACSVADEKKNSGKRPGNDGGSIGTLSATRRSRGSAGLLEGARSTDASPDDDDVSALGGPVCRGPRLLFSYRAKTKSGPPRSQPCHPSRPTRHTPATGPRRRRLSECLVKGAPTLGAPYSSVLETFWPERQISRLRRRERPLQRFSTGS